MIVDAVFVCTLFIDQDEAVRNIAPTDIQRKHRQEREAVVDEALRSSRHHLVSAHKHFGSVIHDQGLRDEFVRSIERAHEILGDLGVEPGAG